MNKIESRSYFSKNLIKYRKERGFTQLELAKISGIPRYLIAYYETKRVNPPINKVETLAKALNIDINKLIKSNTTTTKNKSDFLNFDNRTLSKFKLILSLDKNERHLVYSYIDSLVDKRKKKQTHPIETKN
jgi:transcriptional regulator with XRE-family HTH domain